MAVSRNRFIFFLVINLGLYPHIIVAITVSYDEFIERGTLLEVDLGRMKTLMHHGGECRRRDARGDGKCVQDCDPDKIDSSLLPLLFPTQSRRRPDISVSSVPAHKRDERPRHGSCWWLHDTTTTRAQVAQSDRNWGLHARFLTSPEGESSEPLTGEEHMFSRLSLWTLVD
jgi:hypothetical protein